MTLSIKFAKMKQQTKNKFKAQQCRTVLKNVQKNLVLCHCSIFVKPLEKINKVRNKNERMNRKILTSNTDHLLISFIIIGINLLNKLSKL